MKQLAIAISQLPGLAVVAWAQANPLADEPTLGGRLGGWLAFFVALAVAVIIYRFRRRREASYDSAAPTSTRFDPER